MFDMDEEAIGINAGKVWNALHSKKALTKHQLLVRTQLSEDEIDEAIGWLARENKIKKEGSFFCLDQTNLTESIGSKAGVVYTVLQQLSENVTVLKDLTDLSKEELHRAIGWLAKEDKIPFVSSMQTKQTPIMVTNDQKEFEETIQFLQDEIHTLHQDIDSRNHIIQHLTQQLTEKQTEFMKHTDVVEKLNDQLGKNHFHTSLNPGELQDVQQNIICLSEELHSLREEIHSRNQIIQNLTTQLTDKQTEIIERSDTLDRLQTSLCKQSSQTISNVTSEVQQRIKDVSFLQECLEKKQQQNINQQMENSTLIDKNTPTIRIDPAEHHEISHDINHVLQHHRQPIPFMDEKTNDVTTDKRKSMKS